MCWWGYWWDLFWLISQGATWIEGTQIRLTSICIFIFEGTSCGSCLEAVTWGREEVLNLRLGVSQWGLWLGDPVPYSPWRRGSCEVVGVAVLFHRFMYLDFLWQLYNLEKMGAVLGQKHGYMTFEGSPGSGDNPAALNRSMKKLKDLSGPSPWYSYCFAWLWRPLWMTPLYSLHTREDISCCKPCQEPMDRKGTISQQHYLSVLTLVATGVFWHCMLWQEKTQFRQLLY